MEFIESLKGSVPEAMLESIRTAYKSIFEGVLLENQREIDRMTRDNVYKAIVSNMTGRWQTDWNDPRIHQMYERVREDHTKTVAQFVDDMRNSPAGQHFGVPELEDGQFTNQNGHDLTLMESIRNDLVFNFFHFQGAVTDYLPGVARIALLLPGLGGCGFGSPWAEPSQIKMLKAFVRYASEVCPNPGEEGAEFDANFNGMTLREIMQHYGNAIEDDIRRNRENLRAHNAAGNRGNYRIVQIPDFETARQYANYCPWCVCHTRRMWDAYSLEGHNTVYFCLRDGFENEPAEAGADAPLDAYGLSMICVIVDYEGDMCTATPRWNDAHGSSDYLLTASDVVDIIGRPFYDTFPPVEHEEPDYVRRARGMGGPGMPPGGPGMGGPGMPPPGGRGMMPPRDNNGMIPGGF